MKIKKKSKKIFIVVGSLFLILISIWIFLTGGPFLFLKRNTTRIECILQNKKYVTWGFMRNHVCVTVYPDGGKSCDSSDECESGFCVRLQNNPKTYCRKYSSELPFCITGEETIERVNAPKAGEIDLLFIHCD
jgi:hypothetical protein